MMPVEARTSSALLVLLTGWFLLIGTICAVGAILGVVMNQSPLWILLFCAGLAGVGLGVTILTRNAYSVAVRNDGISLKFVCGREESVSWEQVTAYRNLFLGRRELLQIHNPDPGSLQVTRILVLLRYQVGAKRRFALFGVPGIGPLLGSVKQYRTALDEQAPDSIIKRLAWVPE